ncbi:hypothetical protein CO178_00190 [candidate division WWE3 bacterium CG_4_9_14_3_um_filter_34_6]|uniref:HD domain-containing protein n=1 Tax=candidate division WWE3 bacterium CG_4_9_14_3_um_filter_34_6 TaxID=1975079 RepID=A0A2M7X5J1_UNCKA|nr:MAG: hypothetical protein CO178_00190 [candidate division WWE3 bacterium CG_4_9_14_3_um_filter_34_6]
MLNGQVEFCHKLASVKFLERYSNNPFVKKKDTVASHTWRVAILALIMKEEFEKEGIDFTQLMSLILVHGFMEFGNKNVKALGFRDRKEKAEIEKENAQNLFAGYHDTQWGKRLFALVLEMLNPNTQESLIAKTLDNYESNMHVVEEVEPLKDKDHCKRTIEYIERRRGIDKVLDQLIKVQLKEIENISRK